MAKAFNAYGAAWAKDKANFNSLDKAGRARAAADARREYFDSKKKKF